MRHCRGRPRAYSRRHHPGLEGGFPRRHRDGGGHPSGRVFPWCLRSFSPLGVATVLCVDKTGAHTQNQMAAGGHTAVLGDGITGLSEECHLLLEYAILASKRDRFDPMELTLQSAGDRLLMQTEHLHPEWPLLREYPHTPHLLAVTQIWKTGEGDEAVVACKGAVEAVAGLCHTSPDEHAPMTAGTASLAAEGLRVLGGARTRTNSTVLPALQQELALEFLGLLGPRRSTPGYRAGSGGGVPHGGHPRPDDHRRLSGYRTEHRAPGRHRESRKHAFRPYLRPGSIEPESRPQLAEVKECDG